jgi:uncharacterized protein YbjQ (UPF0145 family)
MVEPAEVRVVDSERQELSQVTMTASPHKIPIVTTFDAPPGTEIERVIGPCWGITVRSRSIVGTACAGCQQVFGGEISALTQLADESRNEAMNRLETHAIAIGANAVLGMRFDSGELMQNTNEIVAYGTAVKLRETGP